MRIVVPRGGVGSGQVIVTGKATANANVPGMAVAVRYATKSGGFYDVLSPTPPDNEPLTPVWVTVNVPATTKPGEYPGRLLVNGIPVPLTVKVSAFTLPATKDYAQWVSMTQSPETVAIQYKVPPYSDAHWKLLEKSLELQGQLADKVLYLPVIAKTWFGNELGMVQFRKNGDRLTPDFAIAEKYLALYTKHCGPPRAVILDLWEPYLLIKDNRPFQDKLWLTLLNPAGKFEMFETGRWPMHRDAWQAVLTGAAALVKKAGLPADALRIGVASDANPEETLVAWFKELAPELKWATFTHGYGGPPGYLPWSYGEFPDNGVAEQAIRGGWDAPPNRIVMNSVRDRHEDNALPVTFRSIPDIAVGVHHNRKSTGLARVGLDCWPIPEGSGKTGRIIGRYQENRTNRLYRHPNWACTAPGPNGALATQRFEMLREGIQDTEARIVLEKALKAKTLPVELAARVEKLLPERSAYLKEVSERRYPANGLVLIEQLLDLAGEVQQIK